MRIMHVLKHAHHGNGHVHVAVDLACAQADAGHQVTFAAVRGPFTNLLRRHGVRVEEVAESRGAAGAVRCARDLWRVARRDRPQVVHAHMMSSAVLSHPVAKSVGAVLVTTVHNSFDRHSFLMRLGTVVVAVSNAERDALLERGFKAHKTVAVLNGADESPREELPRDDIGPLDQPSIMTLSGLHGRKAVDDIIRAFALVVPDFPHWKLNVVGSGPDRDALEGLVRELDLVGSVRFLGSSLTPRYLLETARIFASGSLADPCPLTTTEARAAGCAIVATAVGGVPEVLDSGRAGLLVQPADNAGMARAFRTLMERPEVLDSWRARAKHGSEYFRVSRVAADYEGVYSRALAGRGRGRVRS